MPCAAPLHIDDQHYLQPQSLPRQTVSAPPSVRDKPSADGSQPQTQPLATGAPPIHHLAGALSSKHAAAGAADLLNGPPSASEVVGEAVLPPDTACRPDNTSSAYDTARALVSQAWMQPYTPMFVLGRVALKIPDRHPEDLPPAAMWTRPYCEALEGEGIALVGAYVRHGCIHIVLDFLDLAVGPGAGGGIAGGAGLHPGSLYTLRHGRHRLGSERGERVCSSAGSSRSNSRSNSRRRSGRVAGAAEHEGAAAIATAGRLTQMGGRASAPGDLLPLAAGPGLGAPQPQQLQQQQLQRRAQLGRRNAPARVMSENASVIAAGGGRGGGGVPHGGDGDDDDDDGSGAAAAAARGRMHPLSARRLRQLRRASVPSLLSGPQATQGVLHTGGGGAVATALLPSGHDGFALGGWVPLLPAAAPSPASPFSAAPLRLLESLTPELLVELLGPGIGGGGQTVTVQLSLGGGGGWSMQTVQAGSAAAAAAPSPPPDLTCISPPCVLAGAPGPVVLYAAGSELQGVAAGHGVAASAAADGGAAAGAAAGIGIGPLTVHVRFRGAYQPCRASLLGDQMPAEALGRVLPLDALRRAEVLCLQLEAPPPQPGLMFVECQRGGLLGAALPVLVAPNAGVWQEVTALQNAAVQEGCGQLVWVQRLVTDLGLWLDYLNGAPPAPLQPHPPLQLRLPPQQPPSSPPMESHLTQQQPRPTAGQGPEPNSDLGSDGGVAAGGAPAEPPSGGGGGAADGGLGLSRLFGRSLLRLLSDAEHATELPAAAAVAAVAPWQNRQAGLRQLEEMLSIAEERQCQQQQEQRQQRQRLASGEIELQVPQLAASGAAAEVVAAAPLPQAAEEDDAAAHLRFLAPHVGVAYGSSPGPNTDCDGAAAVVVGEAGLSEYFRAISDPQTRRAEGGEVADAAAEATCAGLLPPAAPPPPPALSRFAAGNDIPGGASRARHIDGGGGVDFGSGSAAAWQELRASAEEGSCQPGSLAGPEGVPSDWAGPSFTAGFGAASGANAEAQAPSSAPVAAAAAAAAPPPAEVAAGGLRVSASGLSLPAAPSPAHPQTLYNGRWQLIPQSPGEGKVAETEDQHEGTEAAAPPPPQAPPALPAQTSGSDGGGAAAAAAAQPTAEACGLSPTISAEILALGPTEAAALSLALMSFGPFTRTSGSLNLPPVRTDSSGTELRSWDSLTEAALAVTAASLPPSSGALTATPMSSATTAASPSPSPRPSLHLIGEAARLWSLAPASAVRRPVEEREARPRLESATSSDVTAAAPASTSTSAAGTPRARVTAAAPPQPPPPGAAAATAAVGGAVDAGAAASGEEVARAHSVSGPTPAAAAAAAEPSEVEAAARAEGPDPSGSIVLPGASSGSAIASGAQTNTPRGTAEAADAEAGDGSPSVATELPAAPTPLLAGAPPRADAEASSLIAFQGACWPAAGGAGAAEPSARLHMRMRHLGLGLLAFSVRRGWVATTAELLAGLFHAGVGLAEADAGVAAREGGMGLLHLAVTARQPALLRALQQHAAAAAAAAAAVAAGGDGEPLSFSWDVGARGPMGLTPLHLAAALEDGGEIAATLLETFPDAPAAWFTAVDDGGCTPAEMAAQARLEAVNQMARARLAATASAAATVTATAWQSPPPDQFQVDQILQLQQLQELHQLQRNLRAHGFQMLQQQEQQLALASGHADGEAASAATAAASCQVSTAAGPAAAADCSSGEAAGREEASSAGPRTAAAGSAVASTAGSAAVGVLNRWLSDLPPPPPPPSQHPSQPQRQSRQQRGASWLRTSLAGFADPRVEAQYRQYRADSLEVVDTTCGILFSCLFLLPALTLARQHRVTELVSHCIFNAGLLGPYLLQAAAPAAFRRHRDVVLMLTDLLKALLVLLALLRVLPLPSAWRDFARGHLDVLMLVVIKPLAEQIRIRAALLQRAAAVVSDTYIYASVLYGGAAVPGLARAVLQNAAALALLLLLDVRARARFQQAITAGAAAAPAVVGNNDADEAHNVSDAALSGERAVGSNKKVD